MRFSAEQHLAAAKLVRRNGANCSWDNCARFIDMSKWLCCLRRPSRKEQRRDQFVEF
jgi:hypothetical protein